MDYREPPQLGHRSAGSRRSSGLLARILTVATGALVLIGAIAVSIVVFAIALVVILGVGIYLWWNTRKVRQHLREQMAAQTQTQPPPPRFNDDNVIEGEVIKKDESETSR